jgi:transcriptional regulator with XRE-family HTH domain
VLRRRRIGRLLRGYRTAAGLTADEVAAELDCSTAKITRIETARSPLYRRDLRDMLELYRLRPEEHQQLQDLLANAETPAWWDRFSDVLSTKYATLIGYESDAATIREYAPQVLPGLLQTQPYAHEVIRKGLPHATYDEVEARVKVRMERQRILTRLRPARLSVVIDEAVLHRQVGGPVAMRQQLDRLTEATTRPNIDIHIHPFDAGVSPYHTGPFMLIEFPDPQDPHVCYLESGAGDRYLEKQPQIQRYGLIYEDLCADALDTYESIDLLKATTSARPDGRRGRWRKP